MRLTWQVPEHEIELRFGPSGGPGGQHANRAHTRVEATFDIASSPSIPPGVRRRVLAALGPTVRVVADDERSQHRNRRLAIERLRARVAAAATPARRRRPTRPTRASQRRRLDAKRRRGDLKRGRRDPRADD